MASSIQPFRFLDLPREIRDEVYNYALCTFSQFNTHTIDHYTRVHAYSLFNQRRFLGTINLLLANKQIHHEGSEYLLKKNRFIRVECCGFNVRDSFRGHTPSISVLATNVNQKASPKNKVDEFPCYAMHIWMGIDRMADGTRKRGRKDYKNMIMLLEDLAEFCKRFEIKGAMRSQSDPDRDPLRIVVKLNPFGEEQEEGKQAKGLPATFFTRHVQENLLLPIKNGLRSFPNLEIEGCTEPDLIHDVTQAVSQPLWPSASSFLSALEVHDSSAAQAYQEGNTLHSVQSCAANISLIIRLRASPSSLQYLQHQTPGFATTLSQHWSDIHLLFARCLHLHLSVPPTSRTFPDDDDTHIKTTCVALSAMLNKCDMLNQTNSLYHFQQAEIRYLSSIALRLAFERTYSDEGDWVPFHVLRRIKGAVAMQPGNEIYAKERAKVGKWFEVKERYDEWRVKRAKEGKGALGRDSEGLPPGWEMMIAWRREVGEWEGM